MLFAGLGSSCAQNAGVDKFATPKGSQVTIHAIKHGSMRIVLSKAGAASVEFEIDPVRSLPPETDYSALPKADFVLITHEHYDHLDAAAVAALYDKERTTVIANAASAQKLKGLGSVRVMKNGDAFEGKDYPYDIRIEAVPAYNTTKGHTQYHPKGNGNGYVLQLDGLKIYIAGDMEDIPELDKMKGVDVCFLPVNQPYTMTVQQAVRAARTIAPKVLFPYHYGDTDVKSLPTLLKDTGIDVRIRNYR